MSAKYIVVNSNTLMYRIAGTDQVGVLASSVIRGGRNPMSGPTYLSPLDDVRPATVEDFDDYRVCAKGHLV